MIEQLITMATTLVADLIAADIPVRHKTHPFKQRSQEHRPGAPVHIRHCYIQTRQTTDGQLTQAGNRRNMVTGATLWVQYPSSLMDLEATMQEDACQLKQRYESPRFYNWPASGIMNITATPGQAQRLPSGGMALPIELQVNHIVSTP